MWRELAFASITAALLFGTVWTVGGRAEAQGEAAAPPLVQCANGQCLISVPELRMLVQRASLCGWEAK